MLRRLCVLAVMLTVGLLQAGPAAADQTAVPDATVAGLLSIFDDGGACTGVPDTLPGIFDFTEACEAHDVCYAAGGDRLACDVEFREDLGDLCRAQHPDVFDVRRYACLGFADLYFFGVRLFGGFFL